jgi:large subunit ribosomal protein L10
LASEKVIEQKKQFVKELSEKLQNACSGVLVEYKGINVQDDTELRRELRKASVDYAVVKNTMLGRAAKEVNIEGFDEVLHGTTALALSNDDYVAPAKILDDFASKHKFFNIKLGFIDDTVVDADKVKALAKLPAKEVLVAQVLGGLNSPITSLAYVLSGCQRGLVYALNAIAEQKGA